MAFWFDANREGSRKETEFVVKEVKESHGSTFVSSVGITRQLEITQESNNQDQLDGIKPSELYLCLHAFCHLADILQSRTMILRQLVHLPLRPVIDSSTKMGVNGMNDTESIAQMLLDATSAPVSRFGGTWFFTKVREGVVGFCTLGGGGLRRLIVSL